jgi:hypothetical protein
MKPVWYGLYERIARANQLTAHDRRKLRREMRSGLRDNLRKARAALAPYAGKTLTGELRDRMKESLIAAFALPEPLEFNITFSDGKILNVTANGALDVAQLARKP